MINSVLLQLSSTGYTVLIAGLFFFPLIISILTVKDIFYSTKLLPNEKLMWTALSIIVPLIGPLIYFFFIKPKVTKR